ncbi:unnamed protein product (macronuclear) [Paramecium tetraurelia]|uniref:Uncharacterized protein n=1 Tax=Paramecium tetraurelia TaxID=5888 RepID=A0C401_PARTE|nr:uncharacterized protein GSPATT00034998001 [Paramecium tetraurelia]CAK65518.1 unnamed protein product [Paramecium tetraurelia]|eukprot:XP_001432915.1 hypothetical protein (macronuclear) [Paramecium tetraurelia strain d4-2]
MQFSCMFCEHKGNLPELLNMALSSKYQTDFWQIQLRSPSTIKFQDQVCFEESEEYHAYPHLQDNRKQLTEYYRYHRDIPRIFIKGITSQLESYHEKQREIKYKKIKKQLGMQVKDTTRDDMIYPFKALKGLSELQTSRQLQQLLKQIKPLRYDKSGIANLIQKQKQQMLQSQNLKKLLKIDNTNTATTLATKRTYHTSHTLQDVKKKTHKKQLTLCTEYSPEERNDFYKRWSDVLSHRQLQYHKKKIKCTLLNKKKSLK